MFEGYLLGLLIFGILGLLFFVLDLLINVPEEIKTADAAKVRVKIYGLCLLGIVLWPVTVVAAIMSTIYFCLSNLWQLFGLTNGES